MKINWKSIKDYIGFYEVSNTGVVRSIDRYVTYSDGRIAFMKGRTLKNGVCKKGYCSVVLSKDGSCTTFSIHRLVATSFLSNLQNLPCVNHMDSNPSNNNISNLEWCTYSHNTKHAYSKNRMNTKRGSKKPNSKLKEEDVILIRELVNTKSYAELADMFGVSRNCIYKAVNKLSWRHI